MENQKQKTIEQITDLELVDQLQQRYEQIIRVQGEISLLDAEKKKRMMNEKQKQKAGSKENNDGSM